MQTVDLHQQANGAFAQRDWQTARDAYMRARAAGPLSAEEVFRLGDCIWWLGEFRAAQSFYEQAHYRYLDEGRPRDAAMVAGTIASLAFMRAEVAYASGWASRAARLLENEPPCAEHGYLLFMDLISNVESNELDSALLQARELQEAGRTFSDPNLVALGVVSEGQALIKQGTLKGGMTLLDEAMLAAVSDSLEPGWAGYIYCQLMSACHEVGDLERARAWTQATERWCDSMSAAGPYPGMCRVHRAQLFQVQGAWDQAEIAAARVCEELADFDLGTVGEGHYQLAEVWRLRGDLASAEEGYRQAHAHGRDPQPGLALLRLAEGRVDEAFASINAAVSNAAGDVLRRAWLSIACVEISLAAGQLDAARTASVELQNIAAKYERSALAAASEQAHGAVLLAEGEPQPALMSLRSACLRWQQLDAPYECARARTLVARAYEALGDASDANLELDAAEQVFRSLGATLDLQALQARRAAPAKLPNGLTARELEVLVLVSDGQTNRGIAEALTISEKTVARHLTNIYGKLGLSSRTEAARFAFDHGLTSLVRKTS